MRMLYRAFRCRSSCLLSVQPGGTGGLDEDTTISLTAPFAVMASTVPNIVSTPYPEARTFWPALVGGIVFVWACVHFALDWYWCAAGILVFFVIAATLSKQATIDCAQRKVYEHSRLFGHRVVRTREFPFSDFEAIVYQYRQSESGDTTSVGLRLRSGRPIWIRSFGTGGTRRGRGAEEFAWRLCCDTGIEIDERTG
jgi:hypothetical protein